MKSIVQTEQDRVLALSPDDQDHTSATTNLAEIIFNVFLKYRFALVELTCQSRVPSHCLNYCSGLTNGRRYGKQGIFWMFSLFLMS